MKGILAPHRPTPAASTPRLNQRRANLSPAGAGTPGRTRAAFPPGSPRRKPWIIVADDLTGATDAAASFAARGHRTAILLDPRQPHPSGFGVLAISTNSRAFAAPAAAATLRRLCTRLQRAGRRILYKKFDSTLKGNIDAELRAVLACGGFDRAVFCPANPVQGRRVCNGILHVDGRTLKPVAAVFHGKPMEVELPDAYTEAHLRALVMKSWANDGKTLLAGSAGLARHLAAVLPEGHANPEQRAANPNRKTRAAAPADSPPRVVIVSGSRNPVTRDQLRHLPGDAALECLELPIHRVAASALERRLRELRDGLVQRPPHALILTGGDTALAVCHILRIRTLELFGEVVPGVALSRALDGVLKGRWIATKPGGFGTPTTLRRGIRRLREL